MSDQFPQEINGHTVQINELGDLECEDCGGIGELPRYFTQFNCALMHREARRLKVTPVVRNRENEEDRELYTNS